MDSIPPDKARGGNHEQWQFAVDRGTLHRVELSVARIETALLGMDGRGGALAALNAVTTSLERHVAGDAELRPEIEKVADLARDNRKRLNAISTGNAIYTSVAAAIAAFVGWFGGKQ